MNDYEADRKEKAALQRLIKEKDAELQRLTAKLEAQQTNDAEEADASSQGVDEVRAELAQLRQSFSEHDMPTNNSEINWDHVPHHQGPSSVGGDTIQIWEDDDVAPDHFSNTPSRTSANAEGLVMGLDVESARQEKTRLFAESRAARTSSFEMNFADSPARRAESALPAAPLPPPDFHHNLAKSLKATSQRAEDAENALAVLETEIKSLGFDGSTATAMVSDIAQHFRSARLELERTLPGETVAGFEKAKVLPEMLRKLKTVITIVTDRDAELKSMRDQQKSLKGNFDHAIITAEKATSKVRDLEDEINRGVDDMLHVRMRNRDMEKELEEKTKSIDSLVKAIKKYENDVKRMQELTLELEAQQVSKFEEAKKEVSEEAAQKMLQLETELALQETGREAAEESAAARLSQIKELVNLLEAVRKDCRTLESQLDELQATVSAQACGRAEEIGALNVRISNLSTALVSANAEVEKLKAQKTKLEERVQHEIQNAERAAEEMQTRIFKAAIKSNDTKNKYLRGAKIRKANWEMANDDDASSSVSGGPMTPASLVRFVDVFDEEQDTSEEVNAEDDHVEGHVELQRGRGGAGRSLRRRKYDSGIGMDSPGQEGARASGLMTPELGSEADLTMAE